MADPLLDLLGNSQPAQQQQDVDPLLSNLGISPTPATRQPKAAPAAKPFGQRLNEGIADVPRQLGLFAREGLEGVGGALDMLATPFRAALNAAGMNIQKGSGMAAADILGLPQPRDAQERVIGDATRMLASGALPIAAGANLARNATGVAQGVGQMMASNPVGQMVSAAAGGGAGGYTRETGGNAGAQLAASLAAGIAAPAALSGVQRAAGAVARAVRPNIPQPAQIDVTINNALRDSGMSLDQLPANVANGIRSDVQQALKIGNGDSSLLSPDALRRLADYRLTGLTPTRARITQDVADITRQANLSKLGANSADPAAQQLAQTTNQNNRGLTAGLNDLGANTSDDLYAGGQKVIDALQAKNSRVQGVINNLYSQARDQEGRSAMLDPHAFTNRAADLLEQANVSSFLPPDIRNKLNLFASGQTPLTVDIAEQFKTGLGRLQRNSSDGNMRYALGQVRQALDETPLLGAAPEGPFGGNQVVPAGAQMAQNMGQDAIDAFGRARTANRKWMGIVERTPALQAIRDGVEPDQFMQRYILGNGGNANVMDVAQLKNAIKGSPDALQAVRDQMVSYLKSKALGGAADETGNFSQSGYNAALKSIGDRKLRLFFEPDQINQLKAIGRVAAYEQFQPAGSAVNNSNTAGGIGNILERIGGSSLLNKVPFGRQAIGDPLQNIVLGIRAGNALNAPGALVNPAQGTAPMNPLLQLSPAAVMGIQDPDEQRRQQLRAAGLLFP